MSTETKKEKEPIMNVEVTQTGLFARQPLSVPGKIAFWAFLVSVLGGIGGNITIASGGGSLSRDLLTSPGVWVEGGIFFAPRVPWGPWGARVFVRTLLF